jgi:hypothetical protein
MDPGRERQKFEAQKPKQPIFPNIGHLISILQVFTSVTYRS